MSFINPWINTYNSIMDLVQDPITGMLKGSYRSTTDGSGTYDVIGWASLTDASNNAGQTMAISILWRSNDGGKSDPSHEVSGMAGQVVVVNPAQNLSLMHLFVETDPDSGMQTGFYPDKLIFTPTNAMASATTGNTSDISKPPVPDPIVKDNISGIWTGSVDRKRIEVKLVLPDPLETNVRGTISYSDGNVYPITGFTDIFAETAGLNRQGISFSTYIDEPGGRICIAMAGYLDLTTNKILLNRLSAQSTKSDSTWQQVIMQSYDLEKKP